MATYDRAVELLGRLSQVEEELSQFIQENASRLQEVTGVPLKQRQGQDTIYTSMAGHRYLLQLYTDMLAKNLGDQAPLALK